MVRKNVNFPTLSKQSSYEWKSQKCINITGSDICPVYCFEFYMAKLNNKRPDLWQKEKKAVKGPEAEWYMNQVIGRDILNDTMKNLSKNAGLSRIYTNHSIRATVVDAMQEHEFKNREIMMTTGHKSEASLNSYSTKLGPKKKREISDFLAKQLNNDNTPKVAPAAVSIPRDQAIDVPQAPQEAEDIQLEAAQLVSQEDWDAPLDDQYLVQVLEKIEKENEHLQKATNVQNGKVNEPGNILVPINSTSGQITHQNQAVSFSANVNQVCNTQPLMYFPGSTVTINYNFISKDQ